MVFKVSYIFLYIFKKFIIDLRFFSRISTNEPSIPLVNTPIPGPKSQRLLNEMSEVHVCYFAY